MYVYYMWEDICAAVVPSIATSGDHCKRLAVLVGTGTPNAASGKEIVVHISGSAGWKMKPAVHAGVCIYM